MEPERYSSFAPPINRDSRHQSRSVLPNGVPAHLPAPPATAYSSRSSYEGSQQSLRQQEPYSRWGNTDSRFSSASTSTLPPPPSRDSRWSEDNGRTSHRDGGREEGRNRSDDTRRGEYDRHDSRSRSSSSRDHRESRESESSHGRSRTKYRKSEEQSPPSSHSSRHQSSSSSHHSQTQAQFYYQQLHQPRSGNANGPIQLERASYSRTSDYSVDGGSRRDHYDRKPEPSTSTRAPLPPPRPGHEPSPQPSEPRSATPEPPPSRNVKSSSKSKSKPSTLPSKTTSSSHRSRNDARSRSRSPGPSSRSRRRKKSPVSRRRSVSRSPLSDSGSATSTKSFVRSSKDVEHSTKKHERGGRAWDAIGEGKKALEIEERRKSKELQELETLANKEKQLEQSSMLPTGPRSLFGGSRGRDQVLISTTFKTNLSNDLPTGPKNTLHASRLKMIGIPTGPRGNGGTNEQLKKFFPGDDSDDDKQKQKKNGASDTSSRANMGTEGRETRMDIDVPPKDSNASHRSNGSSQPPNYHAPVYSTQAPPPLLPNGNSRELPPHLRPSREMKPPPSTVKSTTTEHSGTMPPNSNRYPSVRETLLRRSDSAGATPPISPVSNLSLPSTQPLIQPNIPPLLSDNLDQVTSISGSLPPSAVTPVPVVAPIAVELYERLVQVGEGTYGKVYKAKNTETGALVALKRIRMEAEKDGFPVTAIREIKLLQSLRHPNVVDLIEMMVSRGHVYMVFEYMDHDLTGVLHHPSIHFSPAHLKSLMKQLLEGLGFIHRRGVLHRDLKGSNILLGKNGELKIADFGLARFYLKGRNNDYTNRVITQWYKPPELLFGATIYGSEVDMWSAGCIFLELFARRPVFQGQDEIHQLDVIFKATGTPSVATWPTLQELPWYELVKPTTALPPRLEELYSKWLTPGGLALVGRLLSLDPIGRPDSEEALRMDYFTIEEPKPELPNMLATVKGEWHEYESKRARKRQREEA